MLNELKHYKFHIHDNLIALLLLASPQDTRLKKGAPVIEASQLPPELQICS
jgi:hypothetical protein